MPLCNTEGLFDFAELFSIFPSIFAKTNSDDQY